MVVFNFFIVLAFINNAAGIFTIKNNEMKNVATFTNVLNSITREFFFELGNQNFLVSQANPLRSRASLNHFKTL